MILFANFIIIIVDSMDSHGIRTWRRLFLLPWLIFFSSFLIFLLMLLGYSLYCLRAEWRHVFLLFSIGKNEYIEKIANVSIKFTQFFAVAVFTCWRHMQRQYFMMAYPRPQTLVLDVESVMRELLERDPNLRDNVKDSPPKYEDIASE